MEKILGRKGRRSGGKKADRGRKREKLSGGQRPWGEKGGKDLNRERGEKILGRKRKKILVGKGLRGERGGKDLNREKGENMLGRKREKMSGGGKGLRGERGKG